MNIIVNSDRTVEKEYTEKDGSQNENRVTELNFTLPEEYSGEGFVPKIAFITEDGNFSDYIDNGKYILKNNITKYREVICFVWLTNSVNNIDFRSQTFPLEFYYNEDPSDYIPSEQEKSQIELLMEELEEKIQEVTELEENVYTKDETYSKEEVDEIIPTDISDLNNDSGFIDKDVNNLTNYYKKSETYTKQEIDGKISSVYKYKGTVASYNNLPSTDLTIGDVYNVEDTGDNYAWTGTAWDKLGGDIDLSGYQEKIDNSHKLNADLVDDSNSINKFTSATEKNSWNAKYNKPSGGIPSTDMSSGVQASLRKADTALQAHQDISGKEDSSNKTGVLNSSSTTAQYPHAKAVYDELVERDEEIEKLQTENAQLLADHPDITDTGTDLILNGTGDLEMSVDVGGNSTQVQYSGKNKWSLGNISINGTYESSTSLLLGEIYFETGNYTINLSKELINSSYLYIGPSGSIATNIIKQSTFSVSEAGSYAVRCVRQSGIYNNFEALVQLEQGSTATNYEPYVGGTASPNPNYKQDINNVEGNVVVKGSSKNWFPNTIYNTIDSSGNAELQDNGYYKVQFPGNRKIFENQFNANTQYTISFYGYNASDGNGGKFRFNYTDETYTETVIYYSTETKYSLTSTANKTIASIGLTWGGNNISYIKELQLEEGSTATPYVPHAENIVTFPLSQGQKLMLGDTLEDDGIHHKRRQYVFTGDETIGKSGYSNEDYFCGYYNIIGEKIVLGRILCNILGYAQYSVLPIKEGIWAQTNQSINFSIKASRLTENSVEGVKAYLTQLYNNGTPMVVEYKLETETIEPYTSAQQTAYNKLKELQSYYDLTYVVGTSDNAQPIITAHAKKSIKQLSGGDLSNYQTKITSTNKLNSDLVDDTNQTNKFVTSTEKNTWNAKQNTTDNNLATTNKNITSAINEVNSIAKGANQALSYASYSAMITAFNSASSTDYNVGQNIYIETLEVPDLWVYKVESTSSSYTYTTDEAITTALETTGYIQVGYYKLSALETQKVDLTNYVENTDYANATTGGVVKISILTQSEYNELQTIDTNTFYMIKEERLLL